MFCVSCVSAARCLKKELAVLWCPGACVFIPVVKNKKRDVRCEGMVRIELESEEIAENGNVVESKERRTAHTDTHTHSTWAESPGPACRLRVREHYIHVCFWFGGCVCISVSMRILICNYYEAHLCSSARAVTLIYSYLSQEATLAVLHTHSHTISHSQNSTHS